MNKLWAIAILSMAACVQQHNNDGIYTLHEDKE